MMMYNFSKIDLVAVLLTGLAVGFVGGYILGNIMYSPKENKLKSECEVSLPRNQECTMAFIAPKKPSEDKTTTEVWHSIPK
jgi:hypothetical protein